MPYIVVKKLPVYLNHERWIELQKTCLPDWPPEDIINMRIRTQTGRRLATKAMKAFHEYLERLYFLNPSGFRDQWVRFKYGGDVAKESLSDLLYCYCHFYNRGHIESHLGRSIYRDRDDKLLDRLRRSMQVEGEKEYFDLVMPITKPFSFFDRSVPHVTVSIPVDDVMVIRGELLDFKIWTKTTIIHLNQNVFVELIEHA